MLAPEISEERMRCGEEDEEKEREGTLNDLASLSGPDDDLAIEATGEEARAVGGELAGHDPEAVRREGREKDGDMDRNKREEGEQKERVRVGVATEGEELLASLGVVELEGGVVRTSSDEGLGGARRGVGAAVDDHLVALEGHDVRVGQGRLVDPLHERAGLEAGDEVATLRGERGRREEWEEDGEYLSLLGDGRVVGQGVGHGEGERGVLGEDVGAAHDEALILHELIEGLLGHLLGVVAQEEVVGH